MFVYGFSVLTGERMSANDRRRLLEAIRYLYEHYEDIWESYKKGIHIKQYIEFLRSMNKLRER